MSVHIIELNDRNVVLRNQDDVLIQSPGFANTADKDPLFGEEARKIARLHPRHTFTQFWSQLSLDPLVNSSSHFRHQADLAFAHLDNIGKQQDLKGEVIFTVPSNYNRNQLSVLLGLVQSCEFDAAGVVDMPLLAASTANHPEITVYLDIQLHQSVLTTFRKQEGKLQRDRVVQIPGTGLIALHDAWANMVTDEFIKQSRFDPHHNAETEQYVYNQLEDWINRSLDDNEILMEINNKGAVYQARINQGYFDQRVRNIYGRIRTELENLAGNEYSLALPASQSRLPGLSLYLNNIEAVEDSLLLENCLANLPHIQGDTGAVSFTTSLPSSSPSRDVTTPAVKSPGAPTHLLVGHRAYALPARFQLGKASEDSGSIILNIPGGNGEVDISLNADGTRIAYTGSGVLEINNLAVEDVQSAVAGDVLSIPESGIALTLIQVE